ncbi:MAG: hypothetical protein PHC75_08555 [Burkholderiales bacterium]|nr:hypothetical protein [Burkholderiales bacterium]
MFERFVLMFIIARSYNHYNDLLVNNLATLNDTKNLKKMIKTRDNYLQYNLFVYSSNPVKHHKPTLFIAWDKMSNFYNINQMHHEVKSQVSDLIETIQNKRENMFNYCLSFIGITVALLSFIAAIK